MVQQQLCSICSSDRRGEVEVLLRSGTHSLDEIAKLTGLHRSSIHRHSQHFEERSTDAQAGALQGDHAHLRTWRRLLQKAERAGDFAAATKAQSMVEKIEARLAIQKGKAEPLKRQQADFVEQVRVALGFRPRDEAAEERKRLAKELEEIGQDKTTPPTVAAAAFVVFVWVAENHAPPMAEFLSKIAEMEEKQHELLGDGSEHVEAKQSGSSEK